MARNLRGSALLNLLLVGQLLMNNSWEGLALDKTAGESVPPFGI